MWFSHAVHCAELEHFAHLLLLLAGVEHEVVVPHRLLIFVVHLPLSMQNDVVHVLHIAGVLVFADPSHTAQLLSPELASVLATPLTQQSALPAGLLEQLQPALSVEVSVEAPAPASYLERPDAFQYSIEVTRSEV